MKTEIAVKANQNQKPYGWTDFYKDELRFARFGVISSVLCDIFVLNHWPVTTEMIQTAPVHFVHRLVFDTLFMFITSVIVCDWLEKGFKK